MSILRNPSLQPGARASAQILQNRAECRGFQQLREAAVLAPLTEIVPAGPGDWPAAAGFALAWAARAADAMIVWAAPDISLRDTGVPYAEGLMQFGLAPDRIILVHSRTQIDALWATEEALALPGAFVLCTVMPAKKPLTLAATRRLLLAAERHASRCALLRLDTARATAAWTRWRVASAPSLGEAKELGAPAFSISLERNRAGPSGMSWKLVWSGYEHSFTILEGDPESAMDGDLSAAPCDRPAEAAWASAG